MLFFLVFALAILGVRHYFRWQGTVWDASIMFCFFSMTTTLLLAHTRKPFVVSQPGPRPRIHVVIAVHNEDPEILRGCLESIEAQTMLPDHVHLTDDGSTDPAARELFAAWAKKMEGTISTELTVQRNQGKRHAQAHAFRRGDADIFCTIDSDTILDPRAIEEGIKPFADQRVQGVAGLILGLNWNKNLLTRVIDLEFTNSFVVGRAAMTALGSVLVTCGALAFYRASVVRKNLHRYLNETFLGSAVLSGDDRSLSQYSLIEGRVVLQSTSVCRTAIPERISHLVRQRLRWNSSFYRGVVWVLKNMPISKPAYWMTLWRAVSFLTFTMMLLITIILAPALTGQIAWWYFVYVSILAYVRSLRYLAVQRTDMRVRDQLITFALAPMVAMLYLFILTPVQYLAILKVRQPKWRTRRKVEVALPPSQRRSVSAAEIEEMGQDLTPDELIAMFPPDAFTAGERHVA